MDGLTNAAAMKSKVKIGVEFQGSWSSLPGKHRARRT